MRQSAIRAFVLVMLCILTLTSVAQGNMDEPLSKQSIGIRKSIRKLTPGTQINIYFADGKEEFGEFRSASDKTMTFFNVEQGVEVTVTYSQVKKIKRNYKGHKTIAGMHSEKGMIIGGIVGLFVIGVVLLATHP